MIDARGDVIQYGDKVLHLVEPMSIMEFDFIEVDDIGYHSNENYFHIISKNSPSYDEWILANEIKPEHIIKVNL